ncbi:MAG: MBL fold metallo-hydrolase, partial [Pseudomonadota bacterium]
MTAFDPQYGRSVPVADGIHRISANNPGPFTGAGTNTYILGTDEVMVVDPGPNDPAHVEAIVSAVAGRPVSHILIT